MLPALPRPHIVTSFHRVPFSFTRRILPPARRAVQRLCLELLKKVQAGVIDVVLDLQTEAAALENLMRRYEDTPMSLADACLVRLSELHTDCQVFTLDADFRRYRRHGRQVIPLLAPE